MGENDENDISSETAPATATQTASRTERPYPRRTLEQAYRVPSVIREKNNGNPWPTDQIATALNIKIKSTNFSYIMSAARDYGLVEQAKPSGGQTTWGLTPLGSRAVYPTSDDVAAAAKIEAFRRVDIFAKVVDHYGGNNLPEKTFLENTLHTTFSLPSSSTMSSSTYSRRTADLPVLARL